MSSASRRARRAPVPERFGRPVWRCWRRLDRDPSGQTTKATHGSSVINLDITITLFLLLLIGIGPKIALVPFLEKTKGFRPRSSAPSAGAW